MCVCDDEIMEIEGLIFMHCFLHGDVQGDRSFDFS